MTRRDTPRRALWRALTRIKADTRKFINNRGYALAPDYRPPGVVRYIHDQLDHSAVRMCRAIHRDLTIADRLATADDALCLLVGRLRVLSDQVIEACEAFPRDREWPGLTYVILQRETIDTMRALIRARAA